MEMLHLSLVGYSVELPVAKVIRYFLFLSFSLSGSLFSIPTNWWIRVRN